MHPQTKVPFEKEERIQVSGYTLITKTKSYSWQDDDWVMGLAWQLEQSVTLVDIVHDSNPIHAIAREKLPIILSKNNKEITSQPKGYAKISHDAIMDNIQFEPEKLVSEKILRQKLIK